MKPQYPIAVCILLVIVVCFLATRINWPQPPKPVRSFKTPNGVYVELFIEVDGAKVYRFNDGIRCVYFTDARGAVNWGEVGYRNKSVSTVTDD